MITVSELAKSCNTSTTTIYRALNAVQPRSTGILTEKRKGITYFTDEGEKTIRDYLKPVEQNNDKCSTVFNVVERIEQSENEELLYLRNQNEMLLRELEKVREQSKIDLEREREEKKELQGELKIEREHNRTINITLAELIHSSQELTRNSQVLLKQEQDKTAFLLPDQSPTVSSEQSAPTSDEKKSLWKRIFRQKNR